MLKAHGQTIFDNRKPFKNDEKWFLFHLKIFTFLSWLFGHVEKTARLER